MDILTPHTEFRGFQSLQTWDAFEWWPPHTLPLKLTNIWACGALSLHHAVIALGEPANEEEKGTPAAEFFDEHGTQVADALAEITEVSPRDIQPVLDAYRDASDFHSLVVAPGHDTSCVTALSAVTLARLEDEA